MKSLTPELVKTAASTLSGNGLKVYMMLVYNYDREYGYASTTIKELSADLGIPCNTMYKYINELVDKGFIRVCKNPNKTYNRNNVYYILDNVTPTIKENEAKTMKRKFRRAAVSPNKTMTGPKRCNRPAPVVVETPVNDKFRDAHDELLRIETERLLIRYDQVSVTYFKR